MKSPLLIVLLLILFISTTAQGISDGREFNVVFYNLENLFDTFDDPHTSDNEFLPEGERHWTRRKFMQKITKTGKVVLNSCDFELPDIVGFCEVENRFVLNELLRKTPLGKVGYQLIHKDSPDPRGIDVALMYRTDQCRPLFFEYFPLLDESGELIRSREILYVCFHLLPKDTLHVFFNHWPSRYGGQAETVQKRIRAANKLREKIDEISHSQYSPKIVVMGDFNDEPGNESLLKSLNAKPKNNPDEVGELINLSAGWKNKGTLKHQQSWVVFDQIMVSDYLLDTQGWHAHDTSASILDFDFLLEDDLKYQGKRLYRTYYGFKYHGGYSDHLPIRLKLVYSD